MTTAADEIRAYYALNRVVYAWFAPCYRCLVAPLGPLREGIARMALPRRASRLLDVATGTGDQAFAFARRADEVIGIDISEPMLSVARQSNRFPHVSFRIADGTELPFPERWFDVTAISFALHEMPAPVRKSVVADMARVTTCGGRVVIVDYSLPSSAVARWMVFHVVKLYERDHYSEFVRTDWRALFDGSPLCVRKERLLLGGMARIIVAERLCGMADAISRRSVQGRRASSFAPATG